MIANGKYSDGLLLDSRPVTLDFTAGGELLVRGENLQLTVPFTDVRISDRLGDVPRFLYLPGHATIETPDNAAIDQVLLTRQQANGSRFIHFLETHSGISVGATVALILLVAYTVYFGVPALSRQVAYRVPASIDTQIGRATLAAINKSLLPSQLGARDRQRVQEQLARLLPGMPRSKLPRLEFRSTGTLGPNAFALPGNVILVSDELVQLTGRDDEIAAVLAHELGHLEKRHGLQSILRSSTALLVVSTVTGDLSTLTSFAATLPLVLLQNGYSREFENEADHYAHDLMIARGINLKYFASILKKLEASHAAKGRGHSYLSTHPATEDRIKLFQTVESGDAEEEWQTEDAINSKKSAEESPNAIPEFKLPAPDITQPRTAPVPIVQTPPIYPIDERIAEIEGDAKIEFTVNEDGNTENIFAIAYTTPGFESAAIIAVEKWKFKPGTKNGKPAPTRMMVPVIFALKESEPEGSPKHQDNFITIPNIENRGISSRRNTISNRLYDLGQTDYASSHTPDVQAAEIRRERLLKIVPADVNDYDVPAVCIAPSLPAYPDVKNQPIEGEISYLAIVNTRGEAISVNLLNSTLPEFVKPALRTILLMKFTPAKKNGEAVISIVEIVIHFSPKQPTTIGIYPFRQPSDHPEIHAN